MKILGLDKLFFKLSDNFKGDLSDALIELAEYHREFKKKNKGIAGYKNKHKKVSKFKESNDLEMIIAWKKFLTILKKGKRLNGMIAIVDYSNKTNPQTKEL